MHNYTRIAIHCILVLVLASSLLAQSTFAAGQLVTPGDLNSAIVEASESRTADLNTIRQFLVSEPGTQALAMAGLDYQRVDKAVGTLSDEELSRLAAQAAYAQEEFAAGRLTGGQITLIILVAAVLLIVAIAS
jgi:hypothetical protein